MPQMKAIDTLYNISLSKTRHWILEHAINICQRFVKFEEVECQEAVQQFNQYLNSSVPPTVLEDLYNSPDIFCTTKNCKVCLFENEGPPNPQVILSLYINRNMKTLTTHKFVNDSFWKLTLSSLEKLTRLDLEKVCTDEILEVVGSHCKNLEFVNIVSKSCHTRRKDRHNALKLQSCVSDTGLDFLSNCKLLKEIHMTSIIRKGCGGRQITNEGIRRLLLCLPELRQIHYTDTGLVLDLFPVCCERLSLVSVIDYHPEESRIFRMEILCPFLTELNLAYPFVSDDCGSGVISALTCSSLKISSLVLTHFTFDDNLKNYLEKKGTYLKMFNFTTNFIHSANELIRLLGWTCPNLESMLIVFYASNPGKMNNRLHGSLFDNTCKHFCNLKSLAISGDHWDSSQALPFLLKNAAIIKRVVLNNHSNSGFLDKTLHLIQQTNSFSCLESVNFSRGMNFSFQFLKNFVMSCPVLKNISIENNSQEYCNLVQQLREELLYANFDVNINVYCTA